MLEGNRPCWLAYSMAYGPTAWPMALQHDLWPTAGPTAWLVALQHGLQHGLWPTAWPMAWLVALQHGLKHGLWPYGMVDGPTAWANAVGPSAMLEAMT